MNVTRDVLWAAVLLLVCTSAAGALQQPPGSGEAGIDEKLGTTVPLDLQLTDETGTLVSLKQLIEKPTVLTLNYFRCGGICTPQLTNLARTLNEIGLEPGKDFQVVTVSFDSRDTFEIAALKRVNYLKLMKRPFPPDAWHFLTGEAASTKALADAVGFSFRQQQDMYIHPGALMILSPEGKVTRYVYGITYLASDLEMALGEASKGLVQPTISKALKFCFSYDPEGRRYVLNVTRIAGASVIVLAGGFVAVLLLTGQSRRKKSRLPS